MVKTSDIWWGSYMNYEGPWFTGRQKLAEVAPDASFDYKVLQVITATEGGAFDAVNMYDRCIMTVGLIQWCDAGQFSVCDMLGKVAEHNMEALDPMTKYAANFGYTFDHVGSTKWRFMRGDNVVDTIPEQRQLYLGGASGEKGGWTDETKAVARGWAAAMAGVFQHEDAKDAQAEFTLSRLGIFAFNNSKKILFGADADSSNPIVQAAQAIYTSFAANLPAVADKQIALVNHDDKWSKPWLIRLCRQLTFGPGIAIYPHRYNMIRPQVERLWGLDLPDMAAELKQWSQSFADSMDPSKKKDIEDSVGFSINFMDTKNMQEGLIYIGYDLGSSGADGITGGRTKNAVLQFQTLRGLTPDGVFGPNTRDALIKAVIEKAG
jgi:hypothetical protein